MTACRFSLRKTNKKNNWILIKDKRKKNMHIRYINLVWNFYSEMGTHSDGYVEQELLTTFVTCEGDLSDPQFNTKFARLLKQLQKLLLKGLFSSRGNLTSDFNIFVFFYFFTWNYFKFFETFRNMIFRLFSSKSNLIVFCL